MLSLGARGMRLRPHPCPCTMLFQAPRRAELSPVVISALVLLAAVAAAPPLAAASYASPTIRGGTVADRQIATRVAAVFGRGEVAAVTIGHPYEDGRPTAGRWLYVLLRPPRDPADTAGRWATLLLAAALRDAVRGNPVRGYTISVEGDSNARSTSPLEPTADTRPRASKAQLNGAIERLAKATGVKLTGLSFTRLSPGWVATFSVVARSPQVYLRVFSDIQALMVDAPLSIGGLNVELRDPAGNVFARFAVAHGIPGAVGWVSPTLLGP
jgi:hypothetical protein